MSDLGFQRSLVRRQSVFVDSLPSYLGDSSMVSSENTNYVQGHVNKSAATFVNQTHVDFTNRKDLNLRVNRPVVYKRH